MTTLPSNRAAVANPRIETNFHLPLHDKRAPAASAENRGFCRPNPLIFMGNKNPLKSRPVLPCQACYIIRPMSKFAAFFLVASLLCAAPELSTKKALNLATIKAMVAASEAEAQKRNAQVTICILDESGNLLFLEKADGAGLNTIVFAQKKARHSVFFRSPSKSAADTLKGGNLALLALPDAFPLQGGLPIKVDGQTIGAIGVSGAAAEVDEAIGQAALDAVFGKQ
jgi:glc operon protein GlcG